MPFFGLKYTLLARHGQHVVLIHFPIALFLMGVVFDCAARWTKRQALATVAYYNIVVAALFVIPVWLTGLLAWQWQLEGQKLHGVLLMHLVFGSTAGLLIAVTAWLHFRDRGVNGPSLRRHVLPFELVTALLVMATAHLGGILSGVNVPN